jgi:hypothetical protein
LLKRRAGDAMSKFFINRPIVAMVISIVLVLVGSLTILSLPVAQFPSIAPPEIEIVATLVSRDAGWSSGREKDPRRRNPAVPSTAKHEI